MRRSILIAALAVLGLVLAACGDPTETVTPATPEPEETPEPAPEETPPPDDDEEEADEPNGVTEATAYFLRGEPVDRVAVEPETHELDEPTPAVARASMELLVAGETHDPNLFTHAPEGTEVLDVRIEDRVLIVDLSGEVRNGMGGGSNEAAFAQQLAHTAAQFDGVDAVLLWVEGEPIEDLWGHIGWDEPMEPDPYSLSPIIVESPAWDDELPTGPVTVSGTSLTFESNVVLHLYDPDGELVEETFTTAAQPDIDQRGPFSHTFEAEADRPGRWRVDAIAEDAAGPDEGPGDFVTTVEFDVT
jgi:hypothetical protein